MKVYIAGPITNDPNHKEKFNAAEEKLQAQGLTTMNPAILPPGFEHHEYMKVCLAMVDICDAIYMLPGWALSKGARMEHDRAQETGKMVIYSTQ